MPTLEQVEAANQEQLCRWYRFLPGPGSWAIRRDDFEEVVAREVMVLDRIFERWKEGGGFTPGISKKIGLDGEDLYVTKRRIR